MTHHYIVYIVLLEIEFERGNKMIKITTKDIDDELFEADVDIRGSVKELISDFYVFLDAINKDKRLVLSYGIAIKKWESEHEDN